MPTGKQDNAFIAAIIPSSILDDSITWIGDNLKPDDVFDEKELDDWATSNRYEKKD